eukprot:CAMPEP_0113290816 /NCGR_PEP_ID=MMETSP0008_2-20120614/33668_1 /TAXON_ID=97485 /ORGANISM="Prymnesium parvum" /LENGTH=91 /DNA_ID=CAMNT_0000142589 /DNA_START=564 /DNA_END=839 /DNA_ORIENTATION=+ /assembly_acc=CAM_ASM_000153
MSAPAVAQRGAYQHERHERVDKEQHIARSPLRLANRDDERHPVLLKAGRRVPRPVDGQEAPRLDAHLAVEQRQRHARARGARGPHVHRQRK